LQPAGTAPPERLAELIKNLDSESFRIREMASQDLRHYSLAAEKALRLAAGNKPSLEAGKRLDKLLAALDTDWQGTSMALKLLEEFPSAKACELLENLAKGDAAFRLTREAKTALQRLGKLD
jgi:hypothetical protein